MRPQERATRIVELAHDIAENATLILNDDGGAVAATLLEKSRMLYNLRRKRDAIFDQPGLFSEPSWDMLLEMFSAYLLNENIPEAAICAASKLPMTTALRWLNILEECGYVIRHRDGDATSTPRTHLTAEAVSKLTLLLNEM